MCMRCMSSNGDCKGTHPQEIEEEVGAAGGCIVVGIADEGALELDGRETVAVARPRQQRKVHPEVARVDTGRRARDHHAIQ